LKISEIKRASCAECPSDFELVPPADRAYCVPKSERSKRDCLERFYECEEGHRNKVYWEKEDKGEGNPLAATANNDYGLRPEPTQYGHEQGL
jgi:hypothetical protein